jgi:hypothetical protein
LLNSRRLVEPEDAAMRDGFITRRPLSSTATIGVGRLASL